MKLPVHTSKEVLSSDDVVRLPGARQVTDWYGHALADPLSWVVALDPQALWFSCVLPAGQGRFSAHASGEFVEGLWEEDVAELFIKESGGRYQELNFHPSGAWWSMTHSCYRVRDPNSLPPVLRTVHTELGGGVWNVLASFDRQSFQIPISSTSLLHVSGIARRGDRVAFLSSHPLPEMAPDFHHENCFQSIVLIPCGS